MKYLILILTFWLNQASAQENSFVCGEYQIQGVIRQHQKQYLLKMYEGSLSEVTFTLAKDLEVLSEVYKDEPVTLKGKILSPILGYRGHVDSLLTKKQVESLFSADAPLTARYMRDDIQKRVPDPLVPETDSGLRLIKKISCSTTGAHSN